MSNYELVDLIVKVRVPTMACTGCGKRGRLQPLVLEHSSSLRGFPEVPPGAYRCSSYRPLPHGWVQLRVEHDRGPDDPALRRANLDPEEARWYCPGCVAGLHLVAPQHQIEEA